MFPGPDSCYARSYSKDHLAKNPTQRVTQIAVRPVSSVDDPMLVLDVFLRLRGASAAAFGADAYCTALEDLALDCAVKGDAGGFQVSPDKDSAILIVVSERGMTLENKTALATLDGTRSDDRSFLLFPVTCW